MHSLLGADDEAAGPGLAGDAAAAAVARGLPAGEAASARAAVRLTDPDPSRLPSPAAAAAATGAAAAALSAPFRIAGSRAASAEASASTLSHPHVRRSITLRFRAGQSRCTSEVPLIEELGHLTELSLSGKKLNAA